MRITDYRTYVVATPWRNLTYLILETDEGIRGVGEARVVGRTHTVLEYLKEARRHFIGHDAFDVEALYRRFTLLDFGVAGELAMTALALVEMACWDCIGKKANLPVYQLLGGKVRESIPAYANGWYRVEREPEQFAEAARRVVARGYRALKFDPFGAGDLELTPAELRRSLQLVEAVHGAVGDRAQLLIEMHGRFAPHQAIALARALERFEPGWLEEPCRPQDLGALAVVARRTSIPIATGERLYSAHAYRELFELRAAAVVQPDINQCGGLLEAKKIASTAETYSVMVAPHNVGGVVSTTAALHLLATLRNGKVLEHFNDFADCEVKAAGAPYPEVVDGCFALPRGPGWGIEVDEEFLRSRPPRLEDGVIVDPGLRMFENVDWCRRGEC